MEAAIDIIEMEEIVVKTAVMDVADGSADVFWDVESTKMSVEIAAATVGTFEVIEDHM